MLYQVVADNLETLYGAIGDGALSFKLAKHARKELEGFLDCGLLCRGFARLRCEGCKTSRVVAFSCKGRGFCPSCMGRRMCATAANLVESVIPSVDLRQWVLTYPHAWRKRLSWDGELLSALTRIFTDAVHAFYAAEAASGGTKATWRSGSVTVTQRTSSDMRLNPHLHAVFLDGAYRADDEVPTWRPLGHLHTRDVGAVLEKVVRCMVKLLTQLSLLGNAESADASEDDAQLEGSAVSGQTPPAGPQWRHPLAPLRGQGLALDKPLCASLDGFSLHAATRAGGHDEEGRETLLRYVLRPPLAQDRVVPGPDGLVRIVLKRAFGDGTVAVDLDPLSLLCRLAAAVPPPRYHTVKYGGVLASASKIRPLIAPKPKVDEQVHQQDDEAPKRSHPSGKYRPWAELLKRTFAFDVLRCHQCSGRMKLLSMVTDPTSVARYVKSVDEATEPPARAPPRGPPFWKSTVLRRLELGDVA